MTVASIPEPAAPWTECCPLCWKTLVPTQHKVESDARRHPVDRLMRCFEHLGQDLPEDVARHFDFDVDPDGAFEVEEEFHGTANFSGSASGLIWASDEDDADNKFSPQPTDWEVVQSEFARTGRKRWKDPDGKTTYDTREAAAHALRTRKGQQVRDTLQSDGRLPPGPQPPTHGF